MPKKKPDQVVFNEKENKYNASLLPYATNTGAPKIEATDVTAWKNSNISKVNHQIKTKFEALKKEYQNLMEQYEYNNLVYQANYSFEPIVGQVYFLYESSKKGLFLSLISPEECNFDYRGSFQLNEDKMWIRADKEG